MPSVFFFGGKGGQVESRVIESLGPKFRGSSVSEIIRATQSMQFSISIWFPSIWTSRSQHNALYETGGHAIVFVEGGVAQALLSRL